METTLATPAAPATPATLEAIDAKDVAACFVDNVPIAFARRFGVVGLQVDGRLTLVCDPATPTSVLDNLAIHLGRACGICHAPKEAIFSAINTAYSARDSGVENVIDGLRDADADELCKLIGAGDLLDGDGAAPVIRLVNGILFEAVKRRASDVHVQPYEDRLQVRLRIDGVLHDYVQPPRHLLDEIVSRIKVLGRMNIAEKRIAQDGRTTVTVGDRRVDLRISCIPTSHGERVVLRLLDTSVRLYALAELGLSDRDLTCFQRLIRRSHGILLVTGPTGSGKSTTLYAALQELDASQSNILTLEDPIEYALPGISQTQVSDKKGMTFAGGLRAVLRQDPDVIMVGEIRDQETARMAIQSALTGHLVLSTLHTNDAAGAVARLLDLGIEPYLVASCLLAVMAQRLVRRVCPQCHAMQPLELEVLVRAEQQMIPSGAANVPVAVGCDACFRTGYYDRMGVFELLEITDAVRNLIARQANAAEIKRAAANDGMTTLRQDAVRKLLAGRTTWEEVLRVTHEDEESAEHTTTTSSA